MPLGYGNGMESTARRFTAEELHSLLSHPDAFVRSYADWTREFRGLGTRGLLPSEYAAELNQIRLANRLQILRLNGLAASSQYRINGVSAE